MPTADEEKLAPAAADDMYAAAADLLRPLASDKKKYNLLFVENVSYGFNRNAYGIRLLGAGIALTVCLLTLLHTKVLLIQAPFFCVDEFENFAVGDVVTLAISASLFSAWIFHFTGRTVWLAGVGYARRLWEALDTVKKLSTSTRGGGGTPAPTKTAAPKKPSTGRRKKKVSTEGSISPRSDPDASNNE